MKWVSVPGHHVFNNLQSFQFPASFQFIPKLLVRRGCFPAETGFRYGLKYSRIRPNRLTFGARGYTMRGAHRDTESTAKRVAIYARSHRRPVITNIRGGQFIGFESTAVDRTCDVWVGQVAWIWPESAHHSVTRAPNLVRFVIERVSVEPRTAIAN